MTRPPRARTREANAFEASRRRYQIAMGNQQARVVLAHCPVQVKAPREPFRPAVELEEA